MSYRTVDTLASSVPGRSSVDFTPSSRPPAADNPLLGAMQSASDQMDHLQSQVDAWMAKARARSAAAREAREAIGAVDDALARLQSNGQPERLPERLREVAVRHGLLSSSQATGSFDETALRDLRASLQTAAAAGGESSTIEQIELKQFLSRYENALTLSNAVIAKLRDITSRIVSSL
ncbi:hypothetical protein [Pandoraea pnomenusa]|uniref:hypothetical protein n=1 Tax=Pandoraea pnomenusa TaxID=93220 RepID=UPI00334170F6